MASQMELYVVASDVCNFECGHCINSSGPNAKRWRLSLESAEILARDLSNHSEINIVHFSGGEPTLYPDVLRAFQANMSRPVNYSMTTNGWLGARLRDFLNKVKMDSIVLSYDRFHDPFVEIDNLIEFIGIAKSLKIPIEINFVYENPADVIHAKPLVDAGAKLVMNQLIAGGRAKDRPIALGDKAALNRTCPSLEDLNSGPLEKVVYYPNRGFSPCCGPLIFDHPGRDTFLYSENLANYSDNPLRKSLAQGSFQSQLNALNLRIEDTNFSSICEACVMVYAPIQGEIPALADLARQEQTVEYYPSSRRLPPPFEKILDRKFQVKYFCVAALTAQKAWQNHDIPNPESISTRPISQISEEEFAKFTFKTYYDKFPQYQDDNDRKQFLDTVPHYFKEKIYGKGFYKNGNLVSVIITHQYAKHPATNGSTLHIGYWGYDKTSVTKEEAQWIKAEWFSSLAEWSNHLGGIPVDASIDWFNEPAMKMATGKGFKQTCLRLDKRCE